MPWSQAADWWLGRLVFQRALGAVYLLAFLVAANQFRALLGERGLQPAPRFLRAVRFWQAPSIFHLHYSDRFLTVVAWAGVLLAAAAVLGLPDAGPLWASMAAWSLLWLLYLSIVNVGQTFYAFGWESLLLEAGFLAVFLGPARVAAPGAVVWLIRWLLFRVEFGAGLIKLRGDRCWRDLTCLYHHHETQPLPGPLSWRFHHLPKPAHKAEALANHATQLLLPFGLLAPQPVASYAGAAIVATQAWLVLSGNFSWLNLLTITLAVAAFDDAALGRLLPLGHAPAAAPPGWDRAAVAGLTLLVVVLSWWPVRNLASRRQLMNFRFNPLHLVNAYGAFGTITRERYEVVFEGSDQPAPAPDSAWREYQLKAKPGDPRRRPPQVAPYHLRLDWLLWFAAMSPPFAHPWVLALVAKLLRNDPATLKLLGRNPFPAAPPAVVRARLYRYRFTTPAERRATGAWWVRTAAGGYLPPLRLGDRGRLVEAVESRERSTPTSHRPRGTG
jgi:Lipase maturation factor